MISVSPGMYLLAAFLLLTLPLDWLLAAVCAAAFHEACHLGMVCWLGGWVQGLELGVGGAKIRAWLPGRGSRLLAALAGPLGSLSLLLLAPWLPKLAVCAGVQGLFNLLPLPPLDGGNILKIALEMAVPRYAEQICRGVSLGVLSLIFCLAERELDLPWGAVLAALGVLAGISRYLKGKKSCKRE